MRVAFSVAVSVVTAVAARFSTIGASVAAALLETEQQPCAGDERRLICRCGGQRAPRPRRLYDVVYYELIYRVRAPVGEVQRRAGGEPNIRRVRDGRRCE